MMECWDDQLKKRPDFQQCKDRIEKILKELSSNIVSNSIQSDIPNFPSPSANGYTKLS